ncbi:MAG: ABC transporter ATP-binding protein [Alphaproteobacteria bacterium]|nr:ABC transporter ATP-binding protein [Alphaproteobacteria bacterium]
MDRADIRDQHAQDQHIQHQQERLVEIRNLTIDFAQGNRLIRALHGVDLSLDRGEAVGLVGESGSGKSITWLAALGLLPGKAKIGGSVMFEGRQLLQAPHKLLDTVRGRRVAMIFQDPSSSLNPVLKIGKQITEALSLHRGLKGAAAEAEAKRLLDRVGIANAARRLSDYPHELSGGMNQRAMIAMALAGEPDLLIADEPTTALDATVQAQILALLQDIRRDSHMAMVLISHDLGVVAENVDRVCVMYAGRLVEEASSDRVFDRPRHPYTRGLLAALPALEGARRRLVAIPGTVPEPWNLPRGCAFAPRCGEAEESCHRGQPPQVSVDRDERVLCFHARYHVDPVHPVPAEPAPVAHVAASGHAVAVIAQ